MDQIPCDYLAVDWTGIAWVRYEECYRVNGKIYIGVRPDPRTPIKTEQARCRDADPKSYTRYQIGELEWVCIIPLPSK